MDLFQGPAFARNGGYSVALPGRIVFGPGKRSLLPELLPAGPVLIVAGRHSRGRIESELVPALAGRKSRIVPDIHPEPPLEDVERILSAAREAGAAAIVGWGGGSVIDAAKSAAVLLGHPGSVADYFYGKRKVPARKTFFAALPTTAGTGAEITSNAVLRDPATGIKQSLRHPSMAADVAIVDPELTYDCPPAVTAASGFDALTQAIESFLSRNADTVSLALSLEAAKLLLPQLRAAGDGDEAAREPVAEGSMLAAMAFSSSGLGAVHGIGHPLGSLLGVPHGVCCAVLLPTILEWNQEAAGERLELLAGELFDLAPPGGERKNAAFRNRTEILLHILRKLRADLGLPENFKACGLAPKHYDFIIANCRSGSMKSNPRNLSDDEVRRILESLS